MRACAIIRRDASASSGGTGEPSGRKPQVDASMNASTCAASRGSTRTKLMPGGQPCAGANASPATSGRASTASNSRSTNPRAARRASSVSSANALTSIFGSMPRLA
ncbi:hypothetical protein [Nannocystis pusilla]|uniref:hypothetical protein n=1 Tax=Nannocystis pusilla TaxID=889268 RepID=UPI003B765646